VKLEGFTECIEASDAPHASGDPTQEHDHLDYIEQIIA